MNYLYTRSKMVEWIRTRIVALSLDLTFLLFCGLVLFHGVRTTGDLEWPHDKDLYRDIAQAQTIREGYYGADPMYLGETLWYNPFVPALVAGVSWLTNLPVHLVYTRIGAYLNLLAPTGFYIMLNYLFDRWTALAGTLGFLFIVGKEYPSWASATYSPWLFAANLIQSLFYVTLATYTKALSTNKRGMYFATGILLGMTFLGHTAPALIIGSIISLFTLQMVLQSGKSPLVLIKTATNLGIVAITAFAVSIPLVFSILGHYHLDSLNQAPSSWVWPALALPEFWSFVAANCGLSISTVLTCIGLVGLVLCNPGRIQKSLMLFWLASCIGSLAYSYIRQMLQQNNISVPSVVPGYHFFFYLQALKAILFGYGLVIVSQLVVRLVSHLPYANRQFSANSQRQAWIERAVLGTLIAVAFLAAYPSYGVRDEFVGTRAWAQQRSQDLAKQAFTWIRQYTQPTDVFLTSDSLALFTVSPAGRKVVAVESFFSNPYVDWSTRASERDLMFKYLLAGDRDNFGALASKYQITFVLTPSDQSLAIDSIAPFFLHKKLTTRKGSIYRVVLPPPVNLGNQVEFLGHTIQRGPSQPAMISLYFRRVDKLSNDYTLWFHVRSEQGDYNLDHLLLPPTSQWEKSQVIRDDIDLDVPPGVYKITFGLWLWQDGSRLYRIDNQGHEIEISPVEIK